MKRGYYRLRTGELKFVREDGTFHENVDNDGAVAIDYGWVPGGPYESESKELLGTSSEYATMHPSLMKGLHIGGIYQIIDGEIYGTHKLAKYFTWAGLPERGPVLCNKTMCHRTDCTDCYPAKYSPPVEYLPPTTQFYLDAAQAELIDDTSQARKDTPVFSGFCEYFPLAMQEVARLSKAANDKHNPGERLHWSRDKSTDHGDCLIRHQLEYSDVDPDTGFLHAVAVAWRSMAQLELLLEQE